MTAKKVTHRFKCLVDQTTKLVVWMAYDASELVPPIVEPSLNYIKINFQFDAGFDIYRNYEKYWTRTLLSEIRIKQFITDNERVKKFMT